MLSRYYSIKQLKSDIFKSKNSIYAAHSFYNYKNKEFSQIEFLVLIASGLFFKFFNPKSSLFFYGDKNTSNFIKENTKALNIYDNIFDNVLDDYLIKYSIDLKKFFSFSKFVALDHIYKNFGLPACVLDVDVITFQKIADLVYEKQIVCTHYEKRKGDAYPEFQTLKHPTDYDFPVEAFSYNGYACNTSILGISEPNVLQNYVNEAFKFMNNNFNTNLPELLWIEQVSLPVIADKYSVPIFTIIDDPFNPNIWDFEYFSWCYGHLATLLNRVTSYLTYHIWIKKHSLLINPFYEKLLCLLLLNYIKRIISPDVVENILKIPLFKNLRVPFKVMPYRLTSLIYKLWYLVAEKRWIAFNHNPKVNKKFCRKYNLDDSFKLEV